MKSTVKSKPVLTPSASALKEERKAEASKMRSWAFKNLTLLVSGNILPLKELPNWITCIRQSRMLEDIQAIWLATETVIKMHAADATTACDEDRYDKGLRNLVKIGIQESQDKRA